MKDQNKQFRFIFTALIIYTKGGKKSDHNCIMFPPMKLNSSCL